MISFQAEKIILEGEESAENKKGQKETKDDSEESKLEEKKLRGTKGKKVTAPIILPQTGDDDYPVDPWDQPGPAETLTVQDKSGDDATDPHEWAVWGEDSPGAALDKAGDDATDPHEWSVWDNPGAIISNSMR